MNVWVCLSLLCSRGSLKAVDQFLNVSGVFNIPAIHKILIKTQIYKYIIYIIKYFITSDPKQLEI